VNLGAGEVLLLAIMALILFGPKRLPEIGRQVGRALGELRRMSREFEREVRETTEPFTREFHAAAEPIEHEVRQLEAEVRKAYNVDSDFSSFRPVEEPKTPPQD
jgi:Tat protein translocase TatB subunit